MPEARGLFAQFRRRFSALRPELVVDRPPGSPVADYDLLIDDPKGGIVAVSWRAEESDPWALDHAQHWAANYVLSVGVGEDRHFVTNQHALAALHFTADRNPDVMRELVDGAMLALELQRDRPVLLPEEIQRAADDFRRVLGLRTAEATHRWMEQMQITPRRFRFIVSDELMVAKVKERIVAPEVERYFAEHRPAFEPVRYLRVTMSDARMAGELGLNAAEQGLLGAVNARLATTVAAAGSTLRVEIADARACELPPPIRGAALGAIVGPFEENGASVVAEVLARSPAVLDSRTRALVSARVLREWLDRRAAQATIRWHWI